MHIKKGWLLTIIKRFAIDHPHMSESVRLIINQFVLNAQLVFAHIKHKQWTQEKHEINFIVEFTTQIFLRFAFFDVHFFDAKKRKFLFFTIFPRLVKLA